MLSVLCVLYLGRRDVQEECTLVPHHYPSRGRPLIRQPEVGGIFTIVWLALQSISPSKFSTFPPENVRGSPTMFTHLQGVEF